MRMSAARTPHDRGSFMNLSQFALLNVGTTHNQADASRINIGQPSFDPSFLNNGEAMPF